MAIEILTKFADGIFDDNDLIIDLKFDSEYLSTITEGETSAITETELDYDIPDGDIGITLDKQEDIYGTEMVIYRSLTDSELNFASVESDWNTILINFETNEDYNLTQRFGTPGVPEGTGVTGLFTNLWLDSVFDICYQSGIDELSAQLLTAPPSTSYSYKKMFTRRFKTDEIQNLPDEAATVTTTSTTSTTESPTY